MNLLSYCLFEPRVMHSHRTWDPKRMDSQRYWYNIPSLIIANSILYPKYTTKFYISHSVQYHPLFPVLRDSGIEIEVVDMGFESTSEPMLWRMLPCWDSKVECFFTRDVDSIPNRNEFRATKFFEKNDRYHIQTIRSHVNHYHEQGCDMLGGLSGFRPKVIPNFPKTFEEYYQNRNDMPWAQDQYLMVKTFIHSQEKSYLRQHFLDCPIDDQTQQAVFPCERIHKDQLESVAMNEKQEEVLSLVEEKELSGWAGEPSDARGEFTKKMLEFDNDTAEQMKRIFDDNPTTTEVYC